MYLCKYVYVLSTYLLSHITTSLKNGSQVLYMHLSDHLKQLNLQRLLSFMTGDKSVATSNQKFNISLTKIPIKTSFPHRLHHREHYKNLDKKPKLQTKSDCRYMRQQQLDNNGQKTTDKNNIM